MTDEQLTLAMDWVWLVAQQAGENAPPITGVPGEPTAGEGTATTPGGTTGAPGGPQQGPPPMPWWANPLNLMLIMILGMFFLMMMSGRKQRKQRAALLSSLKKHDRVQTAGGIIGVITDMQGDEVTLRVDEGSNTKIRFARSAIQQVLREGRADGTSSIEPVKERQTA